MLRELRGRAALTVALLLLPAMAAADPVITGISTGSTTANTGSAITITGTGFGNGDDRIWFPGTNNFVNPFAWAAGSVSCIVPATWSGNVQVQTHGAGPLSNGVLLDIVFSYSGSYWQTLPVHWRLNQNGAPGCTVNDTYSAVQEAFYTWDCASDFSEAYDGTTALTATNQDGTNVLSWNNSGWGNPNTIAVTTWWYIGNKKVEADIAFNSQNFTWSCSGAAGSMDVQNIATHEIGHFHWALDLYGTDDNLKTMYGFSSNGETQQRSLTDADERGAEFAYGHGAGRADLNESGTPGGWYAPLVPRNTNDANSGSAPLPGTLNGNATTYANAAMSNTGGDCAAPWSTNYFYVDDNLAYYFTWAGVWSAGLTYGAWTNWPMTVAGGRHTLRMDDDVYNEIPESNESNNRGDAQYVWSPYTLATNTPVFRSVPPDFGPFAAPNSDGFQYPGDWWGCVGIIPTASNDDYDARLFNDYGNSTTGFSSAIATSADIFGKTDFVLWNGNVVGFGQTREAGITMYSQPTAASYVIEATNRYENTFLNPSTTYGSSVATDVVTMGANDIVRVHEVYLSSTTTSYTFVMTNLSGSADLNMSLYTGGSGHYGKFDYVATSQNPGGGTNEQFSYTPSAAGWYGVVVWKAGTGDVGLANTYQLSVGPTLVDFDATVTPGGFDQPNVPRNDNTAGLGNAHVSATLDGNTNDTYVSSAVQQISPNAFSPAWSWHINLDVDNYIIFANVGSNTNTNISWQATSIGPVTVRGGRHSLTTIADPGNLVPENNENNNTFDTQWVWSPLPEALATADVRAAPPNRGGFVQPNGDGLTFTRPSVNAWATGEVGINGSDDYDLYVYSDYSGSTAGFSSFLGGSAFGTGATDYVVGHFQGTPNTLYPEVVRFGIAGGAQNYAEDQNASIGRFSSAANMTWYNQVMDTHRLVDVYEGFFTAGVPVYFQLLRSIGSSGISFEVFPGTVGGVYGRGGGTGDVPVNPGGSQLAFTPATTGWHPIVVFRDGNVGINSPVTYTFLWRNAPVTAVGDAPPPDLEFRGPAPNPVVSETRFDFSLPVSGVVKLTLYDLAGRRVRQLVDGELDAGQHGVSWDATGDSGGRVANGLYWARLETVSGVLQRRVTVLH